MKRLYSIVIIAASVLLSSALWAQAPKTYQIVTNKDNTFSVTGQKKSVITAKPGEVLKLHVIGNKGTEWAKDGSVHSLTINSLKDEGWDLPVKEGANDFTIVAPTTPGEYTIECAIKCGGGHEDMKMKLVVTK